jgi:hypothetical protein
MEHWYYNWCPSTNRHFINSYADSRKSDFVEILKCIPHDILTAAQKIPEVSKYVALMDETIDGRRDAPAAWAECVVSDDDGSTSFHEVWLDACRIPHRTGKIIPFHQYHPVPAVTWFAPPPETETTQNLDDDALPGLSAETRSSVDRIAGTVSGTFPLNDGWTLAGSDKTRLSDIFSIHEMTAYLTRRLVGNARPNCEAVWDKHVNYSIDWKAVWKSLGTPLSDPSEEKTWRKLLHRAIFVRNRDPAAPSKSCRLDGCQATESMHHLAQCGVTRPLWNTLLQDFLGSLPNHTVTVPSNFERLIIFGQQSDKGCPQHMAPPLTRATLRHAWQTLYRHLTKLELSGIPFSIHRVYFETLLAIESAARRLAKAFITASARHRASDTEDDPPSINPITKHLLTVDLTPLPYDSPTVTLTSAFAAALADAKSKADA